MEYKIPQNYCNSVLQMEILLAPLSILLGYANVLAPVTFPWSV